MRWPFSVRYGGGSLTRSYIGVGWLQPARTRPVMTTAQERTDAISFPPASRHLRNGRVRADDVALSIDSVPLAIIAETILIPKGLNAGRRPRRGRRDIGRGRCRIDH